MDRPDRTTVNKPTINRPSISGGNTIDRSRTTINQDNSSRTYSPSYNYSPTNVAVGGSTYNNATLNNAFVSSRPYRISRPWGSYYPSEWNPGYWSGFGAYPAMWAAPLVSSGWAAPIGGEGAVTTVYFNPYYAAPTTVIEGDTTTVPTALDYSQPIEVPTTTEVEEEDDAIPKAAMAAFKKAKTAFKKELYPTAQGHIDKAIKLLPGDTSLHEFRALVLFARGKYKDAAGTLYGVLSRGPGMNWDTMASLYDDTETYTKQLRKLEAVVKKYPKLPENHFLLSYHYLVLDERDGAQEELARVVKLQPKDKLAKQLLEAMKQQAKADPPKEEENTDSDE